MHTQPLTAADIRKAVRHLEERRRPAVDVMLPIHPDSTLGTWLRDDPVEARRIIDALNGVASECGHERCQMPRQDDPLAQFCLGTDDIVCTMVGGKVWYEGNQCGTWVFVSDDVTEQPERLEEAKRAVSDRIADVVAVPTKHRDVDWLARIAWIVRPMTQADLDDYLNFDPTWEV